MNSTKCKHTSHDSLDGYMVFKTKTGLAEEDAKSNGQPRPLGLKVLIMITSLQNFVISGPQGLLMLMGSKVLIKMTRPQNIVLFILMFCGPQNIVLFILMFCGLVIFIKIFDPINIRRP